MALPVGIVVALGISACGGSDAGAQSVTFVEAGQAQLPPPSDFVERGAQASRDTIPVAQDDEPAVTRLASAFSRFQDCLSREGQEFIGIPNPEQPETQDPDYLQALGTCNNETGIAEIYEEFQTENAELEPDQIQGRNEAIILVSECLERRGWDWPDLVPDANGLLNPGGVPQAPPGADATRDMDECAFQNDEVREVAEEAGLVDDS